MAFALGLAAVASGCFDGGTVHAAGPKAPAGHSQVVLLRSAIARVSPSQDARRIKRVAARRPLTDVRTVLPVLGRATSIGGVSWARVPLPGRPNGRAGWIRTANTRHRTTGWHIAVDLSARRVTVTHGGRIQRRFRAVVGSRSTPTPRGRFFIEEAVALSAEDSGGPFALATSARSEVLQEFNGGPGQIALHGTRHLTDPLGTAASHGCIRLSTRGITWMVRRMGRGVPLTIVS